MPTLSARVRVSFDEPAQQAGVRSYAIRGSVDEMRAEIEKWDALGVEHLVVWFGGDSVDAFVAAAERFGREVGDLG
jgi:hypothetical protein